MKFYEKFDTSLNGPYVTPFNDEDLGSFDVQALLWDIFIDH